jgi:hypothetical protein
MQTAAILVLVGLVGLAAAVDIQVRLSGLKGLSQVNESETKSRGYIQKSLLQVYFPGRFVTKNFFLNGY